MRRIEQMYAFVTIADDTEGIVTIQRGGLWLPATGADMARVDSLRPFIQRAATRSSREIKLIRFEVRTELETIKPGG